MSHRTDQELIQALGKGDEEALKCLTKGTTEKYASGTGEYGLLQQRTDDSAALGPCGRLSCDLSGVQGTIPRPVTGLKTREIPGPPHNSGSHVFVFILARPFKVRLLHIHHSIDHHLDKARVPDAGLLENLVVFKHVADHTLAV